MRLICYIHLTKYGRSGSAYRRHEKVYASQHVLWALYDRGRKLLRLKQTTTGGLYARPGCPLVGEEGLLQLPNAIWKLENVMPKALGS